LITITGLANLNIGNNYFNQLKLDEAQVWFEKAIATIPEDDPANRITAYSNKAQSHRQKGEYSTALSDFKKAYQYINTSNIMYVDMWLISNLVALKVVSSQWEDFENIEHLFSRHCTRLAVEYVAAGGELIIDQFTFSLQRYTTLADELTVAQASCHTLPSHNRESSPPQPQHPIRIGYLSYDWRNHPMGRLTKRLILGHDRSLFTSFSLSYGHNDGSDIRREVEIKSQNFVNIFHITNSKTAAETIAAMNLSILIDLTGHTYNGRIEIPARHPADIVVNYLGYPGTTGCTGFDFNMVDARCMPPEFVSGAFTEHVIYLPTTYQAKSMPLDVDPCYNNDRHICRSRLSSVINTKHQTDIKVICSFNANKKFEPVSWAVWMNILRRLPNSIFILLVDNDDVVQNILQELKYLGVSKDRVIFVDMISWEDHLERTPACDVVLDTFVYGAHTTASDMLWMGVPVISLEAYGSGRMPSRVAGSIISSVFSTSSIDWSPLMIVYSVKEYEDLVLQLLQNDTVLLRLRNEILHSSMSGRTFDADIIQSSVERAYHAILEYRFIPGADRKANIVVLQHGRLTDGGQSPILKECLDLLLVSVNNLLSAHFGLQNTAIHLQKLKSVSTRLQIGFPSTAKKLQFHFEGDLAIDKLCSLRSSIRESLGLYTDDSLDYPCQLFDQPSINCSKITEFVQIYLNEKILAWSMLYSALKSCLLVERVPLYAINVLLGTQRILAENGLLAEEDEMYKSVSLLLFTSEKTLSIADAQVEKILNNVDLRLFPGEIYYAPSDALLKSAASTDEQYILRNLTSSYVRNHGAIQNERHSDPW